MADIAIKMGVNAPSDDVEGVLKVLNYIYEQDPSEDDQPFHFSAYEVNFSDGAIGVLASMSFLLNYTAKDGTDKQYSSPLLQSFFRTIEDEKPAFSVVIPARSRKLIRIIYEQREREENEEERSRCVQRMAEEFGLE
ncbi:MAG: hypothetical protein IJ120_03895 [Solobacterium sp.]|nr:hypothetical protein [Solobacterium sp.]